MWWESCRWGSSVLFILMTIIQRLLWLSSDKKAFFYAAPIYHGPSQWRLAAAAAAGALSFKLFAVADTHPEPPFKSKPSENCSQTLSPANPQKQKFSHPTNQKKKHQMLVEWERERSDFVFFRTQSYKVIAHRWGLKPINNKSFNKSWKKRKKPWYEPFSASDSS